MKLYEIIIKPKSAFGTSLKGDTLFGQFCWQAVYCPALIQGGLREGLRQYGTAPFAVFSSAFPRLANASHVRYFFPRPSQNIAGFQSAMDVPGRKKVIENRKNERARKWMVFDREKPINLAGVTFLTDEEVHDAFVSAMGPGPQPVPASGKRSSIMLSVSCPHNSINRNTGTTGLADFAPYTSDVHFYFPGMELAIFVLVDESATNIENVVKGVKSIGEVGFGRDASTGMGRFDVLKAEVMALPVSESIDAMYALAPVVPEKGVYRDMFFTPFVRFGKHGSRLAASGNPFKKPVIMAEEGAVFVPNDKKAFARPWIGSAVDNISYVEKETVAQGYAPWLPLTIGAAI